MLFSLVIKSDLFIKILLSSSCANYAFQYLAILTVRHARFYFFTTLDILINIASYLVLLSNEYENNK